MMFWPVFALLFAVLVLAAEVGFRLGRLAQTRTEGQRAHLGAAQAALLGLVGLLLGFTFAMSEQRYDMRKAAIVREANAIGTARLRSLLLDEPERSRLDELFRRYVGARTAFYAAAHDRRRIAASEREARVIQTALWTGAIAAAEHDRRQGVVVALLDSFNLMIDLEAEALAAQENHVPTAIIALLLLASLVAAGATGYVAGLGGARAALSMAVLPLVIAAVGAVIVDLDRPARGLITVGYASMQRLEQSWAAPR